MLRREREERHPRWVGDRDTAEAPDLQAGERELQVRADRDKMGTRTLGARSVARRDQDQRVPTVQGTPPAAFPLNSAGRRYRPQDSGDSSVAN